jgi:archaeal cell division control protein 6
VTSYNEIVEKCVDTADVRVGLYLMREAGNTAEDKGSRKITTEHVAKAIRKADEFHIKPKEALEEELSIILDLVKDNSGSRIGDVFSSYQKMGGELSYKSFQRRVMKLKDGRFISTEKAITNEGNTTLVHYASHKKLTEF